MAFPNFLLKSSVEAIPKHYHAEFWHENLLTNVRRIRSLLLFAIAGLCFLLYIVHRRNIFNLSDDTRFEIFTMQVLVLLVISTFALLFFVRPANSNSGNSFYFRVLVRVFAVIVILTVQAFVFTLLKTNGHPVFFFQIIVSWSAALLIAPRSAILLGCVMFGTFAAITMRFTPPQENTRFVLESIVSSAAITFISVLSSTILFGNAVKSFNHRKAVEEERNRVAELNEELSAANVEAELMNQELKSRQEVLEEQAMEIEIINTELHEKNEILVGLNDEKNELLGIVSHDLKNPIAAVRGVAELLKAGFLSPTQAASAAEQIIQTSDRMLGLVKNLLDINQLESGARDFQNVQLDIIPLATKIIAQYQAQATLKNIALIVDTEVPHYFVTTDEQAVVQILDNLLSNAIKYSPLGKNVHIRVKSAQKAVRIEIQDEGEGISEADKKRLFGKFTRLSAQPTGGEHSTGLGLSIVKKMVEAMNGRVWCESEVGKGATFIVELPSVLNGTMA